ncbi:MULTISPECIES: SAM-dependent methyltransferase [Hydrocarboniphaga]|jgi:cyclopropane-fatty-acyl-phospholipid synthase|uniref:Type 11 methyltransferase n=1 Tax=Hydrocarboniphaga effusa AP103 TaxID=1172194 RepID=I8T6A0_9GAMM|nr:MULTISPECIES: cyclopropane-fatty-acyl-phospholipid synthase family protein [Hydrocarboniphaga]EIT69273.1 type 11 methyltransferase [Hydrocarboniphaga effusa AP103]MDZ4080735.1 cyclopropane-fatty-acyl-phospholipid synthase family protein [Hydrocarboniphaga sp.]
MNVIDLCERGLIPDTLTRLGMRQLMRRRLSDEAAHDGELRSRRFNEFLSELRASPIAINTQDANTQHYEVPAEFFHLHLGPRLKYSCCFYPSGRETLAQAEEHMLALYAQRAGLVDGQRILDLGCGWGSLSLWLAERYPNSQIVGLSNSHGQREFIERRARVLGLGNLRIVTGNIVEFEFPAAGIEAGFDRVISIEMFEHMKNYGLLLAKIARWLKAEGKLFVHIFAHKLLAYHFEVQGQSDWMSQYFFTGGTMPSENLLLNFQDDLRIEQQWWVDGRHYEKTSNHWLAGMDAQKDEILRVFAPTYGDRSALWFARWRMFYMAVAELFGYADGNEWGVAHYRFAKR